MSVKNKFHFAFLILIALSLVRGFSGPAINASSGLFLTPVSNALGVGIGKLSLYLSVSSVATLFWLPVAGNLLNRFSIKTVSAFSAILQAVAFIALGFVQSVWGFYILAIPLAMGSAVLVNLLGPILINRWFTNNIGLYMGVMMTITSLLGAIFQPLLTTMIAAYGWRFTYVVFGAFALISMLLLILIFLKDSPRSMGKEPFGAKEKTSHKNQQMISGIVATTAIKSPAFYLLLLYMIILTGFAAFSQHITTYGLDTGYTITAIGSALSISMIGAAIGSVLIGVLSDRFGIVPTAIGVMITGLISILLYLLKGEIRPVFISATFLHGLATSSIGVVGPLLVTAFFGAKDYEKIFSYIMMGAPFASIVLMPVYGFIYDSFGSYRPVFLFLLTALLIGMFAIFFGHKNSKNFSREKSA